MFEVDVKNVTEKGRREGETGRGTARVWRSDFSVNIYPQDIFISKEIFVVAVQMKLFNLPPTG